MGGSHDGIVTFDKRVQGLQQIVEDRARDLSLSTNIKKGGHYMMAFEESGRPWNHGCGTACM